MIGVDKMASEEKVINHLDSAQRYIYRKAKASFEKHAKNCRHQYTGAGGEKKCSHQRGGRNCRFELCPLLKEEEKT
ncbi:hypothetical protein AKJ56_01180 [candidate division MSBL1 archaeon SCGC-AAA382N08]|uniref:Uncharacterized protein n=1 Tax=candidate division MSBL1 archaeon SCGC-AAA382N08 TaxID=1698285 RepID=A0A133VPY7_9EURY|nr:hypothetical protein AKJ56_01180 [candidate division MSBL1 archaeon SCGC-AAA382N08]